MVLWARTALAVVFLVAGSAKLRDQGGTRLAMRRFGMPPIAAAGLAPLLPLLELAIAALLLDRPLARAGAAASMLTLLAFSTLVAVSLARGRSFECGCFGSLGAGPIGVRTIGRNSALAALAAVVVIAGPGASPDPPAVALVLLASVGLALTWPMRVGASDPHAPRAGDRAPAFRLPGADGTAVTLERLLAAGRPAMLVFADPDCGPCVSLIPKLEEWERHRGDELTIAVIERRRGGRDPFDGLEQVLSQESDEVARAYGISATPTAIVVGVDGRIARGPAGGSGAIAALVEGPASKPLRRRELIQRGALAWAMTAVAPISAWADAIPRPAAPGIRVRCGSGRCRPRFICRRRERRGHVFHTCGCQHGTRDCSGRCAATSRSPDDCGGCGHRCPPGQVCVRGSCQAGAGSGAGGGSGIGQPCSPSDKCVPGTVCFEGAVATACPPGQSQCSCSCVDLSSDPNNCGACGQPCPPGQVCVNGRCTGSCPPSKQNCGDRCIDVQSDRQNCGRCGNVCRSQAEGGTYINPACCLGQCTDLAVNPNNCGACGHHCSSGCQCQPPGKCTPSVSGMTC